MLVTKPFAQEKHIRVDDMNLLETLLLKLITRKHIL